MSGLSISRVISTSYSIRAYPTQNLVNFLKFFGETDLENRLLKIKEVAAFLGCGATKAYSLIACGEIPSVRLGGKRNAIRVPLL
jgi:excisionase family DNA binding protein